MKIRGIRWVHPKVLQKGELPTQAIAGLGWSGLQEVNFISLISDEIQINDELHNAAEPTR